MRKQQVYLFILFVILLVVGILLGDAGKTFSKAVKICLECIGIG